MSKFSISRIGCSQGRLIQSHNGKLQCFPGDKWQEEFAIASSCGLNYLELLAERNHNSRNPIWSDEGLKQIEKCVISNELETYSACLDFIIDQSIFKEDGNSNDVLSYTINFLRQVKKIGIKVVILPLLERSNPDLFTFNCVTDNLLYLLEECNRLDINLIIESVLDSEKLFKILNYINHPLLGCVYDTGNRFEIGDPVNEITLLSKFIKHIHLKDKRNKQNVVIGTGCVDFLSIFRNLRDLSYEGALCFETNRGKNPKNTMIHNLNFIQYLYKEI